MIIGAGRQAAETYYLLKDIDPANEVKTFIVDTPEPDQQFMGKEVLSANMVLEKYATSSYKPSVLVAIGSIEHNKKMTALFKNAAFPFFSAIHPGIKTDRQRFIGEGVTVGEGCVLTCNISIGNYTLINIGCTVSHDCTIGNHVNISPGSHLAGNVSIDDDVFIGTGATFLPKVKVGKGSIIAAGACVTKDVPPYCMAAGVPAIIKKQLQ